MGVDEEFGRIAPQAPGRVPRAVDAHAVALAGRDFGKQPVPHVCRALGQLEPSFVTARVEEADFDGSAISDCTAMLTPESVGVVPSGNG